MAIEADGAVLADVPVDSMEEDLVEGLSGRNRTQVVYLLEPVLPGDPPGGVVLPRVVLEPAHTRPSARTGGEWSTVGILSSDMSS